MINNAGGLPPFEGQITANPDTGEQHTVHIPFLGTTNAAAVVAALKAADGGSVTMTATTVNSALAVRALDATFSGRGKISDEMHKSQGQLERPAMPSWRLTFGGCGGHLERVRRGPVGRDC